MTPCIVNRPSGTTYLSYAYSYPHKTSYRRLPAPVSLEKLWAPENRENLFLYFHLPFCRNRCGYCNLFSLSRPDDALVADYLQASKLQTETVGRALRPMRFSRMAMGGGTPTCLSTSRLARIFEVAAQVMSADPSEIPASVEVSPDTVNEENAALFDSLGVSRVSVGIQSFVDRELRSLGRPQNATDTRRALELLRKTSCGLNLDLIYGICGQTAESWLESLETAVSYRPEELYLYPLYVRPSTPLYRKTPWKDRRLELYRLGRDYLSSKGYRQLSMRLFRLAGADEAPPDYSCQTDGMVGLGCGARSYTTFLHYSHEYAESPRETRRILEAYSKGTEHAFSQARHGIRLDAEDRMRRHAIKTLLKCEGISRPEFKRIYEKDVLHAIPALSELEAAGWMNATPDRLFLTPSGLERSDAIGPWLYSERVRRLMEEYEER